MPELHSEYFLCGKKSTHELIWLEWIRNISISQCRDLTSHEKAKEDRIAMLSIWYLV